MFTPLLAVKPTYDELYKSDKQAFEKAWAKSQAYGDLRKAVMETGLADEEKYTISQGITGSQNSDLWTPRKSHPSQPLRTSKSLSRTSESLS